MLSITPTAQSRRALIVLSASSLAWIAATIELATPGFLWSVDPDGMMHALLQANTMSMPVLGLDGYAPSSPVTTAVIAIDCLMGLMSATALFYAGCLFRHLLPSHDWTEQNAKRLWRVGLLCLCIPLANTIAGFLQSLALGLDLPAGQAGVNLGIDLSSPAFNQVVMGLLLCAFSLILRDMKHLREENAAYI